MRKLIDVDLWEISIVTFPLLAGARVRAKGSVSSPPSRARARAEREWAAMRGSVLRPAARNAVRRFLPQPSTST